MTVYDNLMQQIDDAGLLFNVTSHSMLARLEKNEATGTFSTCPIPNKRALINAKSGEVISVVSDRYKVVTNEQIFSSFCKSIENSGVDAEGARVNVSQTESGGRAMVDFVFPAHQLQVAGDDSSTALQMCALNSFDGSHRYAVKAGGLRMKCLNGQILGDIVGSYSSTHTASLDVQASADYIVQMITDFNTAGEYWSRMMQTPITWEVADDVIKMFLDLPEDFHPGEKHNARYEHCEALVGRYFQEMGPNLYALYNALTDYVSHPIRQSQNRTVKTTRERAKVQAILNKIPSVLTASFPYRETADIV